MAKKNAKETPVEELKFAEPEPADADLSDREKPISGAVSDEEKETVEEYASASLTPEQREQRRLAKKPKIDHLSDGVALLDDGTVLPLFDVGDRIVVERHISFFANHPWLDTRIYIVRSIDDEKGIVHCTDEEMRYYACIGFRDACTRIKLAPQRGNPFNASKVKKEQAKADLPPGEKKKRGRPKGSKNRPKDVIKAERAAKKVKRKGKTA